MRIVLETIMARTLRATVVMERTGLVTLIKRSFQIGDATTAEAVVILSRYL